jgi:integrating conjugative element protein (TIGR03757 family)
MIRKVSKHRSHVQCIWLVSLALFADTTFADPQGLNPPQVIEVFTTAKHPIIDAEAKGAGSHGQRLDITIYEIDGIQSIERNLSLNLPAEPQLSKQMALHRIQRLDAQTRSSMQSVATGLVKAMQYGVDRYPAIVFDGVAVVYDVTDLTVAVEQYRAWQRGRRP